MTKQKQHKIIFLLEVNRVLVYRVETDSSSFKAFQNKGREGFYLDNEVSKLNKFWEWFDKVTGIVKQSDQIKGCVLVNNEKNELLDNFKDQILSRGYRFVDEADNIWNETELKEFIKKCTTYVDVLYDRKKEIFKNKEIELLVKGINGHIIIQYDDDSEVTIKPKIVKKSQQKEKSSLKEFDASKTQPVEESLNTFCVLPVKKRTKPIAEEEPVKEKKISNNHFDSDFGEAPDKSLPEMSSEDVQRYINERTKDHCRVVEFE